MEVVTAGHSRFHHAWMTLHEPEGITVSLWSGIDTRDRSIAEGHDRKWVAQYGWLWVEGRS